MFARGKLTAGEINGVSLGLFLCFGVTFGCWLFSSREEAFEVGAHVEAKSVSVLVDWHLLGVVPAVGSRRGGVVHGSHGSQNSDHSGGLF